MGMEAGPGPICKRCHDDKWRLSERGWCDTCERGIAPAQDRDVLDALWWSAAPRRGHGASEGDPSL